MAVLEAATTKNAPANIKNIHPSLHLVAPHAVAVFLPPKVTNTHESALEHNNQTSVIHVGTIIFRVVIFFDNLRVIQRRRPGG
jgi:hypothetical protein